MRLASAIDFGTEHQDFLNLLSQNNIDVNSARQVLARIASVDAQRVFVEIFLDYGNPGPGSQDVRIRLYYIKNAGSFVYDGSTIR
jgi:hypothetical protein